MVAIRAFLLSRPLLVVSIGLVVIAAVCAGWFGWAWHQSSASASTGGSGTSGGSAAVAQQALRQGEQDVQAFNTLSYKDLAGGLRHWQAASTGVLRQETTKGWPGFAKQVTKAKTITTATILDAALTSLDQQKNTASIIAAVQITVAPATGSAATKRNRLQGTLTKTSSGWKLSSLSVVPVGSTSSTSP